MRRLWNHMGSVLFDGVCVAAGVGAAFMAAVADYTGDTPAQFWYFRLALSTLPVALVGWVSTFLRHERAWHWWLRFVLFELAALSIVVGTAERIARGNFANGGRFLPAVLLDAAVFLLVLSASRVRWRTVA